MNTLPRPDMVPAGSSEEVGALKAKEACGPGDNTDIIQLVAEHGVIHPRTHHAFEPVLPIHIRHVVFLAQSCCIVCKESLNLFKIDTLSGVCVCRLCALYAHRKCACMDSAAPCTGIIAGAKEKATAPQASGKPPTDEAGSLSSSFSQLRVGFQTVFARLRQHALLQRFFANGERPRSTLSIWEAAIYEIVSNSPVEVADFAPDGSVEAYLHSLLADANSCAGQAVIQLTTLFMSLESSELSAAALLGQARECLNSILCTLLSSLPALEDLSEEAISNISNLCDTYCLSRNQQEMLRRCLELARHEVEAGNAFSAIKVEAYLKSAESSCVQCKDYWFARTHLLNVGLVSSAQMKIRSVVACLETIADEATPSDELMKKLINLVLSSSGGVNQDSSNFISTLREWKAQAIFMRALKSASQSDKGVEEFSLSLLELSIKFFEDE